MNNRVYLSLAIPLTISTMSTPLLGAVDTAVVGKLSDPAYIGGVAVGTIIFNTMYWLFGFLRVSTSAFAAQAEGARDEKQTLMALIRPFFIAAIIGLLFIVIQKPILNVSLGAIGPESDVSAFAADYFGIRIWGAPFALLNYVILGWLMGKSRIKTSLFIQVFMNVMNIILCLVFVNVFSWSVSGVAAATLISEISAFLLGLWVIRKAVNVPGSFSIREGFDRASLKKMMVVNRDLFIRTICLITVFNLFTAKGATFGTETLAANAVLIQIHYLMAYCFDGFANASSLLVGKAIGSRDINLYKKTLSLSARWGLYASFILAASYYLFSDEVILLFTDIPGVIELAHEYGLWIVLFPFSAFIGLIFYGVFTGATEAVPVRNSMLLALMAFLIVQFAAVSNHGNHGLWLAFLAFSLGRSLFLALYIPRLNRKVTELMNDDSLMNSSSF
ncbi:MATE family efflux transporter [Peribacillus frigoritolerans]|uniref:MATE family efflux transporter n=1 Tax=Peribacillus frigoritolerans TaxID=450367 RepID=UPI003F81E7DB